jgi:hypothetical protein
MLRTAGADVKDMYLKTPLDRFEYMKTPIAFLLEDIIKHDQLREKVLNGFVYMEICKTDYHRPASWSTNFSRYIWHIMGTLRNPVHWDYGNLSLVQCGSTYVWMILVSSILEESIYNIYMIHYERNQMKFWKIGKGTYIAGLK